MLRLSDRFYVYSLASSGSFVYVGAAPRLQNTNAKAPDYVSTTQAEADRRVANIPGHKGQEEATPKTGLSSVLLIVLPKKKQKKNTSSLQVFHCRLLKKTQNPITRARPRQFSFKLSSR